MTGVRRQVEDVLRGRPSARSWWLVVACGLAYGAVMGSFGGRPGQALVSATKVPLLLLTTVALGLPSFFVLNTLLGVRSDFAAALRAVIASQAGLTIILVSLVPLTAFWYASSSDYRSAILFNAFMFAVASVGSQWHLHRAYRPLVTRNARHRCCYAPGWCSMRSSACRWAGLRLFVGGRRISPCSSSRRDLWTMPT